jgi:hypothetical protein
MVRSESLVAKDEEAVLEALLCWMSVGSHAPLSLRGEKLARHIRFGTIPVSACASQSLSHSLCRCGCRCGCGCGCGCEAWKTYPIWHHSVPTLSLSLFVSLFVSLSLSLSLSLCLSCLLLAVCCLYARAHTHSDTLEGAATTAAGALVTASHKALLQGAVLHRTRPCRPAVGRERPGRHHN